MNMGIGYKILEDLLVIEVVIIIFIVIMTYAVILVSSYIRKKREENKKAVENYFKDLINENKVFDYKTFPRQWRKIGILTSMVIEFDVMFAANDHWKNIRSPLLTYILLPLARRNSASPQWVRRFFACQIFCLASEKEDERYIIRLSQDKVPLVYLHAITAAIRSVSEEAITICLTRLSTMYWVTQLIYLQFFKEANQTVIQIIEKKLEAEMDPMVKVACYKILINHPNAAALKKASEDLASAQFELRLSALKYIVAVQQESAMPLLIEKLKDDHWEVRLVALHRLGMMKNISAAIPNVVACLHDDNWWIKISAAEILKNLGEEGKMILKEKAPELQLLKFNRTAHITHTLW